MKGHLQEPIFKTLAKVAQANKIPAWVVGGFVRDMVLGRQTKDIDVVVLGSGVDFATLFAKELSEDKYVSYFKNFGTAQVKTREWIIEIIGARKESYQRTSRKPMVEDGSLQDDQNRRDFTINSMYLSLNKENFGELLDPFNGLQDIQDSIIRTPQNPAITFSDDPLRMMRAIRFATRLNYQIEAGTYQAIKENASRILIVSQERITDELNGIIMCDKPGKGFEMLFDTGLLHHVFPELAAMQGIETRDGKSHKDNFYHTLQVLDQLCELSDNLWLRWAAILHDIAKPATKRFEPGEGWTFHGHEDKGSRMVKHIFRKMRLPLDEKMRFVENLVALHLRPIVLGKDVVTDSAVRRLIVDAGEDLEALMKLCRADITSKNKFKVQKHLSNLAKVQEKIDDLIERDKLRNWQPPVTGLHIMEVFDFDDVRLIGVLKNAVREAIIEGEVPNDFDAAVQYMKNKGLEMGLPLRSK
ncbi:MAG: HD domain-containing protein [Bacteroidetes bacterium]|nr:HD domain-containing protein [Bacteroidota bacterium]